MSDGGAFSMGFANAYKMMMDAEEKKKALETNRAIGQMYLESMRAPADAAVAPYQQNNIQAQEDAYKKQIIQESSAMASGLINDNPNYTQKLQGQSAPVAPAIQQQFQSTNQANLQQANNQAQSAEQMLAMAKEKYGTAMFDRLAPIVASGKVPAQAMIGIIEKQVLQAEKQANKLALNSAMSVFGKKDATDEDKKQAAVTIATLKPELGRMFQNYFAPKDDSFTLSQGQTRYVNGKPVASIAPKPDKPTGQLTEYQKYQIANQQNKEPKKLEWEKEHHDYEKTHGMNDAQLVQEYWAMSQDPAQSALLTPDKQTKYNVAAARVNKYLAQPNLTVDEQEFLSGIDRSKVSKEEGFKMLQQYRMNKLNGIRQ